MVSGAISASDWDLIVANLEVADAAVAVAEANLVAEIDFSYTEVRAPTRVGWDSTSWTSNMVGPGDHENLAELVMDPMRVVFEPAAWTADFLEPGREGVEVPVVEFTSTDTTPKGRRSVTLQGVNNTADTGTSTFGPRAVPEPRRHRAPRDLRLGERDRGQPQVLRGGPR